MNQRLVVNVKKHIEYSLGATINEISLSVNLQATLQKWVILCIFRQWFMYFPKTSHQNLVACHGLRQEIRNMMNMTELIELDNAASLGLLKQKLERSKKNMQRIIPCIFFKPSIDPTFDFTKRAKLMYFSDQTLIGQQFF